MIKKGKSIFKDFRFQISNPLSLKREQPLWMIAVKQAHQLVSTEIHFLFRVSKQIYILFSRTFITNQLPMMCQLATIRCMQKFMGIFQGNGVRKYIIIFCPASPITTQWTQTFLKHLQDVLKRPRHLTSKRDIVKTSAKRRLINDVLKMFYLRCLEDVQFTMS